MKYTTKCHFPKFSPLPTGSNGTFVGLSSMNIRRQFITDLKNSIEKRTLHHSRQQLVLNGLRIIIQKESDILDPETIPLQLQQLTLLWDVYGVFLRQSAKSMTPRSAFWPFLSSFYAYNIGTTVAGTVAYSEISNFLNEYHDQGRTSVRSDLWPVSLVHASLQCPTESAMH